MKTNLFVPDFQQNKQVFHLISDTNYLFTWNFKANILNQHFAENPYNFFNFPHIVQQQAQGLVTIHVNILSMYKFMSIHYNYVDSDKALCNRYAFFDRNMHACIMKYCLQCWQIPLPHGDMNIYIYIFRWVIWKYNAFYWIELFRFRSVKRDLQTCMSSFGPPVAILKPYKHWLAAGSVG